MLDSQILTAPQPEPAGSAPAAYAFGRFVLRRRERLLLRDGAPMALGSRAVEVLLALVEADGKLLTKGALLDRVWPDVVVEENNLQVQVMAIRRAFGPDCRDWIATVPGRGYRFTGPVETLGDEDAVGASPIRRAPEASLAPPLSVLVLPFAGRGADPAAGWFADGVTDSLTTDLARVLPSSGTVTAQATADTYKGNHGADVRAIGRAHGVRYVVEGSVLLTADRVRVNAQLIATDTGAHLWAERFDLSRGEDGDALRAQDRIVGRLARAVGLQMIDAEARRAEHEHPSEGTAQDYVLRACYAVVQKGMMSQGMMTQDDVEAACALYARALECDPDNADALAGLAGLRVHQVMNGYLDAGQTVRDEAEAREAHLAEAEHRLARALALVPGHFRALKGRAVLLRARGLFVDAIAAAEVVLARSPGDPIAHREIGLDLLYLGRAEEAVAWFRRADALAPGDDPLRWTWLQGLGRALLQLGRDWEAVEVLRLAVASNPTFALSHALLAAALALVGEEAAARAAMAAFRRAEPETPVDVLAWRCAVPLAATDPRYRGGNARVLDGLRRAAALAP